MASSEAGFTGDVIYRLIMLIVFGGLVGLQIHRGRNYKNQNESKYGRYALLLMVFVWGIRTIDPYGLFGIYPRFFAINICRQILIAAAWSSALFACLHYLKVLLKIQQLGGKSQNSIEDGSAIGINLKYIKKLYYFLMVLMNVSCLVSCIVSETGSVQKNNEMANNATKLYLASGTFAMFSICFINLYVMYKLYGLISISQMTTQQKSGGDAEHDKLATAKSKLRKGAAVTVIITIAVLYLILPKLFVNVFPNNVEYPRCEDLLSLNGFESNDTEDLSEVMVKASEDAAYANQIWLYCYKPNTVNDGKSYIEIPYSFYGWSIMSSSELLGWLFTLGLTWLSRGKVAGTDPTTAKSMTTFSKYTPSKKETVSKITISVASSHQDDNTIPESSPQV